MFQVSAKLDARDSYSPRPKLGLPGGGQDPPPASNHAPYPRKLCAVQSPCGNFGKTSVILSAH
jgi:hypothetical protein